MTVTTVLRLAKVRYLSLTIPAFVVGTMEGPNPNSRYLLLGAVTMLPMQVIAAIGNGVSDRFEDGFDHPQRVALSERVGYAWLQSLTNWSVAIVLGLIAAMALTCSLHVGAIFLWLAFLAATWAYSFGPRLKPRRFSATILLGGLSGAFFFVGWIGGGVSDMAPALSAGILLWVMGASLIGSKDAPDMEGDEAAGYRSVYRNLIESRRPFLRAAFLLSRPYLAAAIFAVLTLPHGPGLSLLWCWSAIPLGICLAWTMTHAETLEERNLVRELGYLYWIAFMGVVLVSLFPGVISLVAALGGLGWFLLASRLLHADPTPRIGNLARISRQEIPS